jgi:hypothetical protein
MRSRQGAAAAPPVVPAAPVVAPPAPHAVAPPAPPPAPSTASTSKAPSYDPWMDDEKTVVTFIVDGKPKRYRVMQ